MKRNLEGKHILITGGSSGIGAATALACADAGMNVTLAARREAQMQDVAREVEKRGRRALALRCDVRSDEDVRNLFAASWDHFGRLDVLFANAGHGLCSAVLDTSDEQHRGIFETNYFGTVRCLREAAEPIRKTPDGLKHMMIVSSAASEIGLPWYGPYAATKAAQDALAGALRGELADEGIAVTSVHPVGTRTEFFDVAAELAGRPSQGPNTPAAFTQSARHVAEGVVKTIRKPRPELWPMPGARFGLAITTAFPRLAAWVMRRHARDYAHQA
ncbi:MAG: SDR family NAD(P)-dependent oxidoreductase [Phycisphaeraceae bacterium]